MARFRIIVVGALLAATLTISGCKRKKPPVPPPQAQAPTISTPETPAQPATTETQPATTPAEPQPESTKPVPEVVKPQPRTHIAKKPRRKPTQPTRIIVEDGGKEVPPTPPPPLVADSSSNLDARQRQTEALLTSSERDVATLNRALSTDEQAIVRHIRSYVDESRQALKVGDVDRAYNLAVKAHLLSDSLKK